MNQTKRLLNIIEVLILAGMLAFIIVMLASGSSRDVPLGEIEQKMVTLEGISDLIRKTDSDVNASFGMTPSEYLYYRNDNIMDVRELLIIKTSSDSEMGQAEDAVSSHLKTQIDNFTGYGTNQVDLLEHALAFKKGLYYFFAVGEQAQEWKEVFMGIIG